MGFFFFFAIALTVENPIIESKIFRIVSSYLTEFKRYDKNNTTELSRIRRYGNLFWEKLSCYGDSFTPRPFQEIVMGKSKETSSIVPPFPYPGTAHCPTLPMYCYAGLCIILFIVKESDELKGNKIEGSIKMGIKLHGLPRKFYVGHTTTSTVDH